MDDSAVDYEWISDIYSNRIIEITCLEKLGVLQWKCIVAREIYL